MKFTRIGFHTLRNEKWFQFFTKKKEFSILVAILLLFAGCSKNDDFILQGTYYLPTDANMEAIRMFTVNGEVLDRKIINDFLNTPKQLPAFEEFPVHETHLSTIFCLNSSTMPIEADAYCNIAFAGNKATIDAQLNMFSTFGETFDADVIRLDPLMIVTASVGTEYMEKPVDIIDYFETVEITKVKWMIGAQQPLPPNWDGKYQMRYNCPFIIERNEISVPILIYFHWKNYLPQDVSCKWGNVFNVANENFLRKISANDTILIQEGKAVLQKR
jgi:hypothetical protein